MCNCLRKVNKVYVLMENKEVKATIRKFIHLKQIEGTSRSKKDISIRQEDGLKTRGLIHSTVLTAQCELILGTLFAENLNCPSNERW